MPAVLTETYPIEPKRKRWTRSECAAMETAGLMDVEQLELVEGELISRMGKKRPHVNASTFVQTWLVRVFGAQYVNVEAPIDVRPEDNPTNEPVPDVIVLARPSREIRMANPQPEDVRLVVEISDTTLGFDLKTKADLYARAGIFEYWVFDVSGKRLIVHRDPQAGRYRSVEVYAADETVAPLAAPGHNFRIADVFED